MSFYFCVLRSLLVYYGHPLRHRRLQNLYRPFVAPGDLAIDVGAHVGNHTRALRALGAQVLAVEPQPRFARLLEFLYRRNPEITVIRAALGSAQGEAQMHVSSRHPTVSTLADGWRQARIADPSFRGTRWDRTETVRVTTLDALAAAHGRPTLVKIDVEGFEPEVLAGLSQPVRTVVFEVLPGASDAAQASLDRLVSLGFTRFNWTIAEQAVLQADWVSAERLGRMLAALPGESREQNIFALHDEI
jgi:FkbM family methyltransferase